MNTKKDEERKKETEKTKEQTKKKMKNKQGTWGLGRMHAVLAEQASQRQAAIDGVDRRDRHALAATADVGRHLTRLGAIGHVRPRLRD